VSLQDNVDAKRATRLKAITEQIGKSLNLTEDQITSDANDIAVLAAGIENVSYIHFFFPLMKATLMIIQPYLFLR